MLIGVVAVGTLAFWGSASAQASGAWPSYGGDLRNSRSQAHPGSIGAATAHRLRETWAVRSEGTVDGSTPSVTGTLAVAKHTAY